MWLILVAVNLSVLVQALFSNNVLRISVCVIPFQTLQNDPTRINAYTAQSKVSFFFYIR